MCNPLQTQKTGRVGELEDDLAHSTSMRGTRMHGEIRAHEVIAESPWRRPSSSNPWALCSITAVLRGCGIDRSTTRVTDERRNTTTWASITKKKKKLVSPVWKSLLRWGLRFEDVPERGSPRKISKAHLFSYFMFRTVRSRGRISFQCTEKEQLPKALPWLQLCRSITAVKISLPRASGLANSPRLGLLLKLSHALSTCHTGNHSAHTWCSFRNTHHDSVPQK